MSRDWHEWYRHYDDPASSLSLRLETVRARLALLLEAADGPVRLLSLCAGDGRDTLPVLAASGADVTAVLVELDPLLSATARESAAALGLGAVEVRTADAGATASFADVAPVDVLLECGVFGNVTDADIARTVAATPSLLRAGGHVVWTRGNNVPVDPTSYDGDPAELVRVLFDDAGFAEVDYVADPSGYRVGVHRWPGPAGRPDPEARLFTFV